MRKRPIFKKEEQNGEIDSASCANPQIKIHEPKFKVDGITKYVENHTFTFDNTFGEDETSADIYKAALKPLIPMLIQNGIVTCFAYGQTGSGKTFTMNELQEQIVKELFELTKKKYGVTVSFFEIYGGRCLDLLNDKLALNILEDKSNNIQIQGLTEKVAEDAKELLATMSKANASRTTHATAANDTSSRSHSICQIFVKRGNEDLGKLVLVDLAGSERAQDTQSNNRQRRMEGAEINKSLLALKECIRAMGDKADHVPFRASKLTLILRDSFIAKVEKSKVVMIACISPGSSSADHSLNTLRYADRLKDNSELNEMYIKMVEENNKRNESLDKNENAEFSKEHLEKINSAKNIKKEESKGNNQRANIPANKAPPKAANNSGVNLKKEEPAKKVEKVEKVEESVKKGNRSTSVKKTVASSVSNQKSHNTSGNNGNNSGNSSKNTSLPKHNSFDNEIAEEIDIEENNLKQERKKKVKDDVDPMKRTMKSGENKDEYFAFQEKVTNILDEQEEVFATHMAAIKEDAKLLTMESELISKVQGVGYVDYDIDSYVEKLESVIKKKLKIYNLLAKKIEGFKTALKEEDEIRLKVKDTFYY